MIRFQMTTFAAVLVTLAVSPAVSGQTRGSTTTIQNDNGRSATLDRDISRNGTSSVGRATIQSNSGRSAERQFERSYDPATRTYQRSSQTTNRRGAVSSSSGTTSCDGAGNCYNERQFTGPNGRQRNATTQGSVDGNGNVNATTTINRAYGQTAVRNRSSSGSFGNRSGTVSTTGPNGTTSREFNRGYVPGQGYQRQSTTTGPRGRTYSGSATVNCGGQSCDRRAIRTGPNGRTRQVDGTTVRTGPGQFNNSRRVTRPNGTSRSSNRWIRVDRNRRR